MNDEMKLRWVDGVLVDPGTPCFPGPDDVLPAGQACHGRDFNDGAPVRAWGPLGGIRAYHCPFCAGWIVRPVGERWANDATRRGRVFVCVRCGGEVGFRGVVSPDALEALEENRRLRAAIANGRDACTYCSLPKAEWSKCASGFPGCARADDAAGCPWFGRDET